MRLLANEKDQLTVCNKTKPPLMETMPTRRYTYNRDEHYDDDDRRRRRHHLHHASDKINQDLEGLWVHTVEFHTPKHRLVSLVVGSITKVMLLNRTSFGNLYAITTTDGARTVVISDYEWDEFNDYLFDPTHLRRKHGSTERDCHIGKHPTTTTTAHNAMSDEDDV